MLLAFIIVVCCFTYVAMGMFTGAYVNKLLDESYEPTERDFISGFAGVFWFVSIMFVLGVRFKDLGDQLATASLEKKYQRIKKQKKLRVAIEQAQAEIEQAEAELDAELSGSDHKTTA